MDEMDLAAVPADCELVLTVPRSLTKGQREFLQAEVARELPGRKVLILDDGMQLGRLGDSEQLARIEAKLDALLKALAEEDEEHDLTSLDGEQFGGERDQTIEL